MLVQNIQTDNRTPYSDTRNRTTLIVQYSFKNFFLVASRLSSFVFMDVARALRPQDTDANLKKKNPFCQRILHAP